MNYHLATMNLLDFSAWLQKQLDDREWRPTELARRANMSDAAVSRIMRGERKADPDSLIAIAKALKIPAEQVFRAAGILPPTHEEDEWVEEMNHKLKLIPPRLRGIAGSLIESMLQGEESQPKAKPKVKSVKA